MATSHYYGGGPFHQTYHPHTHHHSNTMSNTDYRHGAAQYPYQQSTSADGFTPEMRDRQARGKDPYHDSGDDSEGASGDWAGRKRGFRYAFIDLFALLNCPCPRSNSDP